MAAMTKPIERRRAETASPDRIRTRQEGV